MIRLVGERLSLNPETDLRPALIVSAATAAVRSAADVWETSDRSVQLEELIEQAFSVLEAGLGSVYRSDDASTDTYTTAGDSSTASASSRYS